MVGTFITHRSNLGEAHKERNSKQCPFGFLSDVKQCPFKTETGYIHVQIDHGIATTHIVTRILK